MAACQNTYTNAPIPQKLQKTQYETHYRYIVPEDPALIACAQQCEENYEQCLETMDATLCRDEYHSCFRLCGGQVEQTRVCISGCS